MTPEELGYLIERTRRRLDFVNSQVVIGRVSADVGPIEEITFSDLVAALGVSGGLPGGTVTSVGLTMPSLFSVSGSPVTSSGTLAVSFASKAANTVLAGPTSGASGTPTMRALVVADIPTLTTAKVSDAVSTGATAQTKSGNLGIGAPPSASHALTVQASGPAQVRLVGSSPDASGGLFLGAVAEGSDENEGYIAAGAEGTSTAGSISTWTARSTSAGILHVDNGQWVFYGDTGLTSGASFTPTARMTLTPGGQLQLPIATGTSPLSVSSTTVCNNLNADRVDGQHAADLLARANHTGTQAWSTLTSTPTTLAGYGITDACSDAELAAHAATTSGVHGITAFGATLVDDANAAAARSTLGLGTASTLDVPASGDAAVGEVVKGNDSRLTDARTPAAHTHPASQISDSTSAGRAVLTAADAAAQRTAMGLGTSATYDIPASGNATTGQVVKGDDTRLSDARTPSAHTHPATDISDSTGFGRAMLTVADDVDALSLLGLLGSSGTNIDATARHYTRVNSSGVGYSRRTLNVIAGSGIGVTVSDDSGNEEVDLTISATAGSAHSLPLVTTSTDHTADGDDCFIICTATTGTLTVTLPVAGISPGKIYYVRRQAGSTETVSIVDADSNAIKDLSTTAGCVGLVWTGTEYVEFCITGS